MPLKLDRLKAVDWTSRLEIQHSLSRTEEPMVPSGMGTSKLSAMVDLIGVSESVFNNMKYIASIKACTPVIVAELENTEFRRWLVAFPCFVDFVLKNLVTRFHYTANFSANCQTSAPKVNLAKYFIDRYNVELNTSLPDYHGSVRIQETHERIGTFLGMSPRTVERHIRTLKEDGLISTTKGKVYISPSQYQELLNLVASNL